MTQHGHLANARRYTTRFGKLHVIVTCFNPVRFASRYYLLDDFVRQATAAGAIVWLAETAQGDRPWEVTDEANPYHIQFRARDELWMKESMINSVVSLLPHDWEYVAWIDADLTFVNGDWVQETIQQLQHYAVVQCFEHAIDLGPGGLPCGATFKGFPASVVSGAALPKGEYYYYYDKKNYFHPGYAWACRREAWDKLGGLLDINIVGGGDHQMAHAFYGNVKNAIPFKSTSAYRNSILAWQARALLLKQNVGFVPGTILHHWHGKKSRRGYFDRWQILARNKYDPVTDLIRNRYGILQLAGNKPKLRDDLRAYFRARQEDGIDM